MITPSYPVAAVARRLVGAAVLILAALCGGTAAVADGVAVMADIETIGFGETWTGVARREVRPGGHVMAVLRLPDDVCADLEFSGAAPELLVFVPTRLETPSSEGTPGGTYHDLLVPRDASTCGLSPYMLAEWRAERSGTVLVSSPGGSVRIEVEVVGEVRRPARPMLVGLTTSYIMAGHPGLPWSQAPALAAAYADLLAAHHVQPIHGWIRFPPIVDGRLDLDAGAETGGSFRQRVMAYAGAGPVAFPRARWYPDPAAYLMALEQTVIAEGLAGRAFVYADDEPGDIEALAAELRPYRTLAPSVLVMVTTTRDARLDGLVDIYAPVINRLGRDGWPGPGDYTGTGLWAYPSCMGSCGPNRAAEPFPAREPGPDTGLPDFLIDRPAGRLFDYFRELAAIDAGAGLYYEAVEAHRLVAQGIDPVADPWNFGGNGDGLLVYPGHAGRFGLERDGPLASWRLKLIRHAIETWW